MEQDERQLTIEHMLQQLADNPQFAALAERYPFAEISMSVQDGYYVSGSLRVTARPRRRSGRAT